VPLRAAGQRRGPPPRRDLRPRGADRRVLQGLLLAAGLCGLPDALKRLLKVAAPPYLYSGPSPIASLASALVGLQINDTRGDELRAILYARTRRVLDHLDKLGVATPNTSGFPIIEVPLQDPDDLPRAGRFLLDHGIYATLAFYPGVPRHQVGFRLQLTAANTTSRSPSCSPSSTSSPTPSRCAPATPDTTAAPGRVPGIRRAVWRSAEPVR